MRFLFSIVAVISFGLTFAQKTIKVIDLATYKPVANVLVSKSDKSVVFGKTNETHYIVCKRLNGPQQDNKKVGAMFACENSVIISRAAKNFADVTHVVKPSPRCVSIGAYSKRSCCAWIISWIVPMEHL